MINVTRSSMPDYEEYCAEIKDLWESHWLTNMGTKHAQLQAELQRFLGCPHVELYTNGHLALENMLAVYQFAPGSEIITTPFTFASTTHAIVRNGLTPVFCDNPAASILGDASSDLGVSALFTDSLSISDLTFIYAFLLNQVNIDARVIGCMGRYNDSDLSLLQDWYDTVSQPQWLWNVVKFSDEEAYHVDLGFEFLSSYDERGTELDKPYDVRFFGASDKTRGEYFDMWYNTDFFIVNPAESRNCPTCTEDMKDFEIDN